MPYLDWGGAGVALVFIPGMGSSAHVFDEFTPRLTDRFRADGHSLGGDEITAFAGRLAEASVRVTHAARRTRE